MSVKRTVSISGTILPDTVSQAGIKTVAVAFQSAYRQDGRDWGFYHDDGTISHISLPNSGSIGGVRVTNLQWSPQDPADYATGTFQYSVTLEADYPLLLGGIISWKESVRITGTGGPKVGWAETIVGPPRAQTTQQRTLVRASQSGTAVGFGGYPLIPGPLWPDFEQLDQRQTGHDSPEKQGGTFTDYPSSWSYSFVAPVPLVGFPRAR